MSPKKKSKSKMGREDHAQMAYLGIRQMLFTGEIVPGQKISYRELAERMDMSLTPVIQALKRFEHQGLVRHEPNRGYFTEPISLQEVEEIYELREVIEVSLLSESLKRLDETHLTRLGGLLNNDETATREVVLNERLRKDREFHLTLAGISGRKIQVQVLEHLFDLLYLKYSGSLIFVASERVVGSQHQAVLEAIATRDVKKARQAMCTHFRVVKKHALESLKQVLASRNRRPMANIY